MNKSKSNQYLKPILKKWSASTYVPPCLIQRQAENLQSRRDVFSIVFLSMYISLPVHCHPSLHTSNLIWIPCDRAVKEKKQKK